MKALTEGWSGAAYKSFRDVHQARRAFVDGPEHHVLPPAHPPRSVPRPPPAGPTPLNHPTFSTANPISADAPPQYVPSSSTRPTGPPRRSPSPTTSDVLSTITSTVSEGTTATSSSISRETGPRRSRAAWVVVRGIKPGIYFDRYVLLRSRITVANSSTDRQLSSCWGQARRARSAGLMTRRARAHTLQRSSGLVGWLSSRMSSRMRVTRGREDTGRHSQQGLGITGRYVDYIVQSIRIVWVLRKKLIVRT